MMTTVHYERGFGGIILTEAERAALQDAHDQQRAEVDANKSGLGLGTPIHECCSSSSYEHEANGEVVDPVVKAWIEGAVGVNRREGLNADFIHAYGVAQC